MNLEQISRPHSKSTGRCDQEKHRSHAYLWAALAAPLLCTLTACSTPTTRFGSEDPIGDYKNSRADGAAWAAEGFSFRKQMPLRPANDFEFYYKHCDLTGNESFTSKTSYWCTSP